MRGTTAWYGTGFSVPGNATIQSEAVEQLTQGITLRPWFDELVDIQLLRRPVLLPHWMFMFLFAFCAAAPWIGWRFRLRTLLISFLFVAVFLTARRIILSH